MSRRFTDIYNAEGFTRAEMQRLAIVDPKLFASLRQTLQTDTIEKERKQYEDSLILFFARAWREIDPAELSINWHHRMIADHLEDITHGYIRNLIVNIPPRHTKALDVNTPVMTTWGWRAHGDIEPGDFVFGPNGRPERVTGISPKTIRPCFEVLFDDGSVIVACGEHLWDVERDYRYGGLGGTRIRKREVVQTQGLIGSTGDIIQRPDRIPMHEPIRLPPRRLLIDPYVLGAWLGDGSTDSASLTVGDQDIEHFKPLGPIVRSDDRNGTGRFVHRILLKGVQKRLRVLGLLGNKHIPADYLEASVEQRLELLRGLMDTDGTATADGQSRYVTKLEHLGFQVAMLARSLGIKAHQREAWSELNGVRYGPYQEIAFRPPPGMRVFNLERKHLRMKEASSPRATGRYVTSITPIGDRLVNCIKVEGELYLAGEQFVTTHNTLLTNVMWPAWVWAQPPERKGPLSGPQVKFLCVSYGATLSEEIALKMQRLIKGEWYQSLWGDRVRLFEDQQARANFGNTAGGERISNSIEGGILGRGGDCKIIDDPQTRKGADSDLSRAESLRGMSDLTSRVTDPRYAAQVLLMQRLHQQDATDWALRNWAGEVVHLMYPARFDPDRAVPSDPRKFAGELLWPEVWSEKELLAIEKGLNALDGEILSDYAVSGQLQQAPIPRGGGIVNEQDWKMWPEWVPELQDMTITADGSAYVPLPPVSHVILVLDTALSERETADWNACLVIGVWHRPRQLVKIVGQEEAFIDEGEQPRAILMGGWRRRGKLNDPTLGRDLRPLGLVQLVADTARRLPVDRIIIENKTRGKDVRDELMRQFSEDGFMIQMFEPTGHGDKVAKLHSVQPLFSQGLIYAPARCILTTDNQGNERVEVSEFEWVREVISEVASLPKGTHDDYVDCLTIGLITLREEGLLTLNDEFVRQQVALHMHRRKVTSVRDSYGV
jgi:predicted phage terminase large subunit-like protein